jgi:hypothetical protein
VILDVATASSRWIENLPRDRHPELLEYQYLHELPLEGAVIRFEAG